jgi:hypothetical protein
MRRAFHAVLQVAAQDAVFDEHRARRGIALVVDRERPAAIRNRAVVDDSDARRGNALADAAAEGRRALAIEVAFQAVADRLVQQDAGPARPEHDAHHSGRARDAPRGSRAPGAPASFAISRGAPS